MGPSVASGLRAAVLSLMVLVAGAAAAALAGAAPGSFIGSLSRTSVIAGAVPPSGPARGDENPYGVAVVSRTAGRLVRGDVLVSNFNDAKNEQGTGSSIVEISPAGAQRVFAVVSPPTGTPAVGLTTALAALRNGDVVVGSLPAPGGKSAAMTAGALTVLDSGGRVVKTITAPDINGPWDMTAAADGSNVALFVTNVLNGTVAGNGHTVDGGTVVRLVLSPGRVPRVLSNEVIASGFGEHTDPDALVVGPTGVALGRGGVLYVADSVANRLAAIPSALRRRSVLTGAGVTVARGGALNDPLGVAVAPNGDVVSANGGDGRMVETRPSGGVADVRTLVRNGGGDLFGLAVAPRGAGLYFVDDAGSGRGANSLSLLR